MGHPHNRPQPQQSHIYVNAGQAEVIRQHQPPLPHQSLQPTGQHNHHNTYLPDHPGVGPHGSGQGPNPGPFSPQPTGAQMGNYQNVEVIRQFHQGGRPVDPQGQVAGAQAPPHPHHMSPHHSHRPIGTVAPNTQPPLQHHLINTVAGTSPQVRSHQLEPSDAGIIPPEYRTSFQPTNTTTTSAMTSQSVMMTSQQQPTSSPPSRVPGSAGAQQEKNPAMPVKQPHQFSSNPVDEWAKEQVCQWLLALGMESYITLFMDKTISGTALLNLDSSGLKELGIKNKEDREKIKKKIKELKSHNEREKRDMEKKAAAAAAASNSSAAAGSSSGGGSSMSSKAASAREHLLKKAEKVIKKK